VVVQELQDLKSRLVEAEERFQRAFCEQFLTPFPLSGSSHKTWLDLLRSAHLLGIVDFICDVMPALLEKANSAESEAAASLDTIENFTPSRGKKNGTTARTRNRCYLQAAQMEAPKGESRRDLLSQPCEKIRVVHVAKRRGL
jgi:hypothetical protein